MPTEDENDTEPSTSPWWAAMAAVFAFVGGLLAVVDRARGPVFIVAAVLAICLGAIREVLALRRRDKARQWRRVARVSVAVAVVTSALGVMLADAGRAPGEPVRATAKYQWSEEEDGLTYAMADTPSTAQVANIKQAREIDDIKTAFERTPAVRVGSVVDNDGATTWRSRVRFTLRGNRDEPVLIEGIRADADCGPPLDGALFYGPPQGAEPTVDLAFDLDAADPIARVPGTHGLPSDTPYFDGHYITLNRDEPVVLIAVGNTASQHCSWEIELDIQGEDKPQTIGLDNGQPFETTSIGQVDYASTYNLDLGEMAFVEGPLPDHLNRD